MKAFPLIGPGKESPGFLYTFDLGDEHEDFEIVCDGVELYVEELDGSASVKFGRNNGASWKLSEGKTISLRPEGYQRVYITNAVQVGKTLKVMLGNFHVNHPLGASLSLGSSMEVSGGVAHDAVESEAPVAVGALARSTEPGAVGEDDRVRLFADVHGRLGVCTLDNVLAVRGEGFSSTGTVAATGSGVDQTLGAQACAYILLQNNHASNELNYAVGGVASATTFALAAGETVELLVANRNQVHVFAAAAHPYTHAYFAE